MRRFTFSKVFKITKVQVEEAVTRLSGDDYGAHCMVIYHDLDTLRQFYSMYAKRQVEERKEEMVVIWPFYETTDSVRKTLSTGHSAIDVSKHQEDNMLAIVDAATIYRSDKEALSFQKMMAELSKKNDKNRCVAFMGDMGAFQNRFNRNELLDYELSLPKTYDKDRKGFCLYHRKDFDMLSQDQKQKLVEHHGVVLELECKG